MRLATRLIVLVGLSSVAWAAPCVTPVGEVISTPQSADGTERTFTGTVYPFGDLSGALQIFPNADGTFTGQFAFRADKGVVYGTIAGAFTSPYTYVERLTFTGGTKKFSDISGYIDFTGAFNPDGTATDAVTGGEVCL